MNIILSTHTRHNYFRITAATLIEALRHEKDYTIYLYHDCHESELPSIVGDFKNLVLLNQLSHPTIDHLYVNMISDAFKRIDETQSKYYEFALLLDSDCIVHPLIAQKYRAMIDDLPDMGLGSVFSCLARDVTGPAKRGYVKKQYLNALGSLYKKDLWLKCFEGKGVANFEPVYGNFVGAQEGYEVYCTEKSYIQHFGFEGTHSRKPGHPLGPVDTSTVFYNS